MKAMRRFLAIAGSLLAVAVAGGSARGQNCNAPLGWWESKDLAPLFTNPNGPAPTTDCDFHVWSWTAFVHWVQNDPATGQPKFLGLHTPDDLNPRTRLAKGQRTLVLKPRTLKPKTVGSIAQAGSGGAIVDQHGRAVYYSTHMDDIYFNFAKQYYGVANYQKAQPTTVFPIGATVFKASWRVLSPAEQTSQLVRRVYTTKASIARLVNDENGAAVPSRVLIPDVTVALVGLHVVGVIKDHPEFAWGTFENDGNAPDLPPGMAPNSPDPVSAQGFALYKPGTPANQCNPVDSQGNPVKVTVANEQTQALSPVTNVFRQFIYGGAAPPRAADIISANKNFRGELPQHPKQLHPVFARYRLVGTVWIKAGTLQPGDGNMMTEAIGSTSLANATLETYVQGTGQNCFMCHNTAASSPPGAYPGKDINLSHTLMAPFFGGD